VSGAAALDGDKTVLQLARGSAAGADGEAAAIGRSDTLPTGVTTAGVPQAKVSSSARGGVSAPLVDAVTFLAHVQPFLTRQFDQAGARDARQDRARQRRA
jgi:hypothetical protein